MSATASRLTEKWYKTFEAARAVKITAEADALDGVTFNPRRGAQRLNDYFDEWLPARLVKGKPLALATQREYRGLWRRVIADTVGKLQLRAIRPETVRRWYSEVTVERSAQQAAKAYRVLRAGMATAEADELIRLNPCRIRGGGQEHSDERPMIETSLVLELADAIADPYRALVLIAGFVGLRTGESLGLRRADVNLLHATLRVSRQALQIAGHGRVLVEPKTEAGRRTVAVSAVVVDALDHHLATYTGHEPDAPVFRGPAGGPMRRATLSHAWQAAVKATGAPEGLRLHDLRHHAATLTARMPGVTTKELMARIGHASPRAALIYQHATAERDRRVAAFLDDQAAAASQARKARVVELDPGSRGVGVGLAAEE